MVFVVLSLDERSILKYMDSLPISWFFSYVIQNPNSGADWKYLLCITKLWTFRARFFFLTFHLQIWSKAAAPVQQTCTLTCIFHSSCPLQYPLQSRLLFLIQHLSSDDQSKGDSVFLVRLIIPPFSDVMTVCMLIASFQDHFSTASLQRKIAWEVDLISLSDLMWKGNSTLQQCGILMQ